MERRKFIKTTSLAALAASHYLPACASNPGIPVIDTHQHLWDLGLFPLRWVKPPINRTFLMADYLEEVAGHNLVKAVYMEVGVPPEFRRKEAEWARKLCMDRGNPTVAAVIKADPSKDDFASYIRRYEDDPYIKGIRFLPRMEGNTVPEPALSNIRLLGELGMSMDMNPSPGRLNSCLPILDRCPDTRFILDHCGNADPVAFTAPGKNTPREPKHDQEAWYRDMEELAKHPNLVCKISGIVDNVIDYPLGPEDLKPIVDHCFDVFGPDRVMFGGDWPVCLRNMSLGNWISLLKEIVRNRPLTEQRKLFHDNAESFYGLG